MGRKREYAQPEITEYGNLVEITAHTPSDDPPGEGPPSSLPKGGPW